ncbi:hypothetical protein D3C71_1080400 [compost metagenome]
MITQRNGKYTSLKQFIRILDYLALNGGIFYKFTHLKIRRDTGRCLTIDLDKYREIKES